jgi:hypothetical protein
MRDLFVQMLKQKFGKKKGENVIGGVVVFF